MAIVALSALLHSPAQANVWKYVDENGITHFTNVQPAQESQVVIQSGAASPSATGLPARSPSPSDAGTRSTVALINASPGYKAVQATMSSAAQTYGVDYELIKAVVSAESAFKPSAVSNKGAVGLMQIMPTTAQRYGVQSEPGATIARKLADPELNIHTGTRYLADLLRLFGGQTELAVAAYNAGEGAVARAGNRIPDYKETRHYVKKVMAVYRALQTY